MVKKLKRIKIGAEAHLDTYSNELVFNTEGQVKRVRIEPLTSELLAVIVSKGNVLVTREELITSIWNGNDGVGNKALTKNIYKLRKVFESMGLENPIETIPKKGYRFSTVQSLKKTARFKKQWMVAAAIIVAFIALKIAVPGLFHQFSHRFMH